VVLGTLDDVGLAAHIEVKRTAVSLANLTVVSKCTTMSLHKFNFQSLHRAAGPCKYFFLDFPVLQEQSYQGLREIHAWSAVSSEGTSTISPSPLKPTHVPSDSL